ncbi:MAG TPA: cystathionine gamma-synthase [Sphingobacteriaceae bacterium]|nr:cystathionine gamma-synthase [Sphingobacteriaceae bacterium]
MKLETIAIHAGNQIDAATGAVIQPITLTTTFERDENGGSASGYFYTRAGNPNRHSLEQVLAQLEGGADACAFSSGNAAGSAFFQALEPGSHIIAPDDMYHGLKAQLNETFKGVLEADYIDLSDMKVLESAIHKETRAIWIETPSNPLLKVTDIRAVCAIARKHNLLVCCDSTFATPVFQRPFELGVDIIMHSTTKYIGGHSDVLGGTLITKEKNKLWEKIRRNQELSGAVPSPFDCFLTVRGIKTLPYRMRGHAENALKIAEFLEKHPKVEKVFYPGLKTDAGYEIASKQMSGFGAMISFQVRGGASEAQQVAGSLKIFTQATSLGGVESLVERRAAVEGPDTKTPQNLLRISVGLENQADLIEDLSLAINKL